MSARAKFLFDTDFALADSPRQRTVALAEHQAALDAAEARGYRQGIAAGKADAVAEHEKRLIAAISKTAAGLEALVQGLKGVEARLESEAVEVALAVANKLATTLIEREPFAEVSALASECFRHLVSAPHVVVRIYDQLFEEAHTRLTQIAERNGFSGRLVVLADPDMAPGDCRIEWADGGATRDRAVIEAAIGEAVDRYLAVRRPGSAADELRSRK
jgi:flagellar assembly protein FliH